MYNQVIEYLKPKGKGYEAKAVEAARAIAACPAIGGAAFVWTAEHVPLDVILDVMRELKAGGKKYIHGRCAFMVGPPWDDKDAPFSESFWAEHLGRVFHEANLIDETIETLLDCEPSDGPCTWIKAANSGWQLPETHWQSILRAAMKANDLLPSPDYQFPSYSNFPRGYPLALPFGFRGTATLDGKDPLPPPPAPGQPPCGMVCLNVAPTASPGVLTVKQAMDYDWAPVETACPEATRAWFVKFSNAVKVAEQATQLLTPRAADRKKRPNIGRVSG